MRRIAATLATLAIVTVALGAQQQSPPLSPPTAAPVRYTEFKNAQLTVSHGDKTSQQDARLSFKTADFEILNADTQQVIKAFPYTAIKAAEYSYSKAPRWKSGIFISPLLFLSSGKKHWLLVKSADDYALMRLDKNNYKLVIAELETRAGLKVEAQGENK